MIVRVCDSVYRAATSITISHSHTSAHTMADSPVDVPAALEFAIDLAKKAGEKILQAFKLSNEAKGRPCVVVQPGRQSVV